MPITLNDILKKNDITNNKLNYYIIDTCLIKLHRSFFKKTILNKKNAFLIDGGESVKNFENYLSIMNSLLSNKVDKNAVLIVIGGGSILDLGGFIASTYKRGIKHVFIPTTLMAQVDASIGGKTALNIGNSKNMIGTVYQPIKIIIENFWLATLHQDDIYSGFAEMLKHALINNFNYWNDLTNLKKINCQFIIPFIQKSIEIKKQIVAQDVNDKSVRQSLNLGHTIGHALESYYLEINKPISHGHAVALGILIESYIATKINNLNGAVFNNIKDNILKYYDFPKESFNKKLFYNFMLHDKKNTSKKITFSLLSAIGSVECNIKVELKEVKKLIINYLEEKLINQSAS